MRVGTGSKLALGIVDLMFSNQNFRLQLVLVTGAIALLYSWIRCNAFAGGTEEQVCDVNADYALGMEDYSETIRRHVEVVREHPDTPSLIIIWVLPKE
jgi:hypothetical protein